MNFRKYLLEFFHNASIMIINKFKHIATGNYEFVVL